MPHVRRRYFKLNSQQAATTQENKLTFGNFWCEHGEGTQSSLLGEIHPSRCPLWFPKFTCCEMLAFVAEKGHQRICFHPLQKNLCFHEFSVRPSMSSRFFSVTKGRILSAVFIGTEHVFTPLYVSASHFKLLFLLDTLGFSAPTAHIQNPLDCRPDDWAREQPLIPRFMSKLIEVEMQTFHLHNLQSLLPDYSAFVRDGECWL